MPQKVKIKTIINIDQLPFPSPTITYDIFGRVSELAYIYKSIKVIYNASWEGETNILNTYSQTIEDKE